MKISIKQRMVNKVERWVLDYRPPGGKRVRSVFDTKKLAVAEAGLVCDSVAKSGEVWLGLDGRKRAELIDLVDLTHKEGFSLSDVVQAREKPQAKKARPALGKTFEDFMTEKRGTGIATKTITALDSNVGSFVEGRELVALEDVTRQDVVEWLKQWKLRTWNSYLTSINTFFYWCVAAGLLQKSPSASIPKIKAKQMPDIDEPPTILNIEQATKLLRTCHEHDADLLPYIFLGLFAGLRPDSESSDAEWDHIKGDQLHVPGLHAKDRKARYVDMPPVLQQWLKLKWQLPPINLRKRTESLREKAGLISFEVRTKEVKAPKRGKLVTKWAGQKITWSGWGQNVLRHTFSSHALPCSGPTRRGRLLFTRLRGNQMTTDQAETFLLCLASVIALLALRKRQ